MDATIFLGFISHGPGIISLFRHPSNASRKSAQTSSQRPVPLMSRMSLLATSAGRASHISTVQPLPGTAASLKPAGKIVFARGTASRSPGQGGVEESEHNATEFEIAAPLPQRRPLGGACCVATPPHHCACAPLNSKGWVGVGLLLLHCACAADSGLGFFSGAGSPGHDRPLEAVV